LAPVVPFSSNTIAQIAENANYSARFGELAASFTNLTFGGIDCGLSPRLCEEHQITTYPSLAIFKADSTDRIDFDGEFSFDGFFAFIEDYTGFNRKRLLQNLATLTPRNLDTLAATKTCVLAIF
jgi:hypothetical protein